MNYVRSGAGKLKNLDKHCTSYVNTSASYTPLYSHGLSTASINGLSLLWWLNPPVNQ